MKTEDSATLLDKMLKARQIRLTRSDRCARRPP